MKQKKFKCRVCGRKHDKAWQVAQHMRLKHPDQVASKRGKTSVPNGKGAYEEVHSSYAFGHVQAWLEIYARSAGLSPAALTSRVARLLQRSARGQVVGSDD